MQFSIMEGSIAIHDYTIKPEIFIIVYYGVLILIYSTAGTTHTLKWLLQIWYVTTEIIVAK